MLLFRLIIVILDDGSKFVVVTSHNYEITIPATIHKIHINAS